MTINIDASCFVSQPEWFTSIYDTFGVFEKEIRFALRRQRSLYFVTTHRRCLESASKIGAEKQEYQPLRSALFIVT